MRRVHADLLLLACAAIWGFALLFQKSAMAHIEPLLFIGARGFVAAAALTPFILLERRRSPAPSGRRLVAMSALAGSAFLVANYLQQRGLQTASVMNAGFLTGLYVVITPFISFALMGRAIAPAIWAAVALSFAGMWLLGGGTLGGFGEGDLLVAVSALFWALHLVLLGMAAPLGRIALFTALQFLLIGIVAMIGAQLWEPISLAGLQAAAVDILYVGVLAGALTFAAFTFALRATTPTEAAIIVSTDTVFAALGAWLVLGEQLTPIGAIGAAAILSAILMVQLVSARRR